MAAKDVVTGIAVGAAIVGALAVGLPVIAQVKKFQDPSLVRLEVKKLADGKCEGEAVYLIEPSDSDVKAVTGSPYRTVPFKSDGSCNLSGALASLAVKAEAQKVADWPESVVALPIEKAK